MTWQWQWAPDRWTGEDKIQHYGWSGWLWLELELASPWLWQRVVLFALIAILVELVEGARMERYVDRLTNVLLPNTALRLQQPFFCDWPSYRDLAWDVAGALSSALVYQATLFLRGMQ